MSSSRNVRIFLLGALAIAIAGVIADSAVAQERSPEAEAIANLEWRPIGPANMGGRVSAIAGIPGNPKIFYVGGADGGIFRTRNAGVTFDELFVEEDVYSAGAIAIAESDHNVIWFGTGEGDPRNSTSYGTGVYRSLDAGDTWTHLGLERTERIKRIVVHPNDPEAAYVCAMGRAWGPNPERGVFKTSDGGESWEQVLSIDDDTGCSDIAMNWSNPRILFAGMWTFRRRPWRFDDGGGETALYRSKDAGATWEKLTNGMPEGPMARIGVAIAQNDPDVVYMMTEAKDEGMLWRSDDGGDRWRMVNDDPNINFRPFYYSDIHVDPNNSEVAYSLSGSLLKTTDGGRTFERIGQGVHGDHQSFWIDPEDSRYVLSGSDGGYQVSHDAAENFDIINNMTLSQFYQLDLDDQDPYWVCGGLQDNGNWCGPSNSLHSAGILKDDWFTVSGGDGFYTVPVPGQPNLVYSNSQGGNIMLTDTLTGGVRRIHPYPKIVGSAGDAIVDHRYRFNWDSPIQISPHDPATVYFGGNVLFRSRDYGYTWDEISPDLTTDDPEKQASSGGAIYVDNTAAEFHTTILTVAESPARAGVIWVGTDDGNIHVTQDGGATWSQVDGNADGLPAFAWIAKIDASPHDAATAFVAVDNHRLDDFDPYVFKTADYGQSWTNLAGGLPQDDYVKVVRQDPRNADLLYVGMERGMQASWDGGGSWTSIRNGLPAVSVRDIKIHGRDNDLVIATHGRGAFILDDITPLQEISTAVGRDSYLFPVRRGTRWQTARRDASQGQRSYSAPNPPTGALIYYYLGDTPAEGAELQLVVSNSDGEEIRTIDLLDEGDEEDAEDAVSPGVNRTVWNLTHDGPTPVEGEEPQGGFFGPPTGPRVAPGTYTVALRGDGIDHSRTVEVRGDPRVSMSEADYLAQVNSLMTLRDLASEVNGAISLTESLVAQLTDIREAVTRSSGAVDESDLIEAIDDAIGEVENLSSDYLRRPPPRMGYRQRPRVSEEIRSLTRSIGGVEARPTEPQLARVEQIAGEADTALGAVDQLVSSVIDRLNDRLSGYSRILIDQAGGGR
jgi:hypothetical protein